MTPSILIVGATGNTGSNVVRLLPDLLKTTIGDHRIIALTRDANSPTSKELAKISHVEVIEKDWTVIDVDWLKANEVVRAFVASHNLLSQYTDESTLHIALLEAGVKYIVRISTMEEYVSSTNPVYYGRTHWAIEQALSDPEFEPLQWTSLRPNVFCSVYLGILVQWIKDYKQTGEQQPLKLLLDADDTLAPVEADDVGRIAATLLASNDPSRHNKARYIIRGAEDITGQEMLDLVERYTSMKVQVIRFRDTSQIKDLAKYRYPERIIPSILRAIDPI